MPSLHADITPARMGRRCGFVPDPPYGASEGGHTSVASSIA